MIIFFINTGVDFAPVVFSSCIVRDYCILICARGAELVFPCNELNELSLIGTKFNESTLTEVQKLLKK